MKDEGRQSGKKRKKKKKQPKRIWYSSSRLTVCSKCRLTLCNC